MAEGATVANAFVQVMPSMEGATSNITSALVPGIESAGDKAGASFGNIFSGKVGTAMKALGGALVGYLAIDKLTSSFGEVEAGLNNLKIATGATGDAANGLKDVYLEVSKNVVGSFENIGSAVGELNTRFGLQGEELEAASEQAMKYAKITGQDATKAIQDVSRMMNSAGIPASEYASTLDKLTVAGQAAGVDVGKLATTVTDNAASFKEMGLSTDDAIAMLANFEKSGANTSAILAGMKKGVAEWAKEGKSAKDGFAEFVQGVQDGTITSADAIDIFGARAGVTMFDAAQKGQLSFDDMYAAITQNSSGALDAIYEDTLTAGEKFDLFGQKIQAGFFEIMEPIVSAIMPYVDAALEGVGEVVEGIVSAVMPFIDAFSAAVTPIIEAVLPELRAVVDEVMADIGAMFGEVWPDIQNIVTHAMQIISKVIETAWPAIKGIISAAMEAISTVIEVAWPIISTVVEIAMNAIDAIIENVWPVVVGVVETATGAIRGAIDALSPIVDTVRGIFDGVKRAIEDPIGAAKDFIRGIIDNIEDMFSWMRIDIPSFDLPHIDWGWESIGGLVDVPVFYGIDWYAKGGLVSDATLIGAGERGTELIWPSYEPYLSQYAEAIADHMGGTGGVDIHDCTFEIRQESDIRRVAVELNTLVNRQLAGGRSWH